MRKILSKSALTKIVNCQYYPHNKSQLSVIYNRSQMAYSKQQKRTISDKLEILQQFNVIFEKYEKSFMRLISRESGRPVFYLAEEMQDAKQVLNDMAKNIYDLLGKGRIDPQGYVYTKNMPIGTVLYIPSWRYPILQTMISSVANLILGNCVIMNTPENLPSSYERIQQFMIEAGWNSGEYQKIITHESQLEKIIDEKCIRGVHFSGKKDLGKLIATKAGRKLIKSVIKLEGSGSFAILPDADISEAVKAAIKSITLNSGQDCYSPKMFLVSSQVYDQFKQKLLSRARNLLPGDPSQYRVNYGPIIGNSDSNDLYNQVAKIHTQWQLVGRYYNIPRFFPLTIFQTDAFQSYDNININNLVGPVICLKKIQDSQQMIQEINNQENNLYSICFGKYTDKTQKFLDQIDTGSIWFNKLPNIKENLPMGGIKQYGYGRDLGTDGFKQFANIKLYEHKVHPLMKMKTFDT